MRAPIYTFHDPPYTDDERAGAIRIASYSNGGAMRIAGNYHAAAGSLGFVVNGREWFLSYAAWWYVDDLDAADGYGQAQRYAQARSQDTRAADLIRKGWNPSRALIDTITGVHASN